MAGYNDPGHPAGLPSEPSPRRLPAGDGSGATAQMEGLQGPGSLQPGFRQCSFPNLKRGDARCKSTTRNRKTKTHGQNGPNGKNHRGGEGEATRPKRKKNRNPEPRNPKKTEETPESHGKTPRKRRRNLEERVPAEEAIRVRECLHDTQGKCKTSGPPGTAEVSHFPAPESVVENKQK